MRRGGKPHQQIYRPGSGPLRRSGEHSTSTALGIDYQQPTDDGKYSSISSRRGSGPAHPDHRPIANNYDRDGDAARRRSKKPDQTYYVPKPVAQAREVHSYSNHDNGDPSEYANGDVGDLHDGGPRSSKRYSQRRRGVPALSDSSKRNWRSGSSPARQGSEPRSLPYQSDCRGLRDTRSVEPTIIQSKTAGGVSIHQQQHASSASSSSSNKPPSGRRHSSVGIEFEKRKPIKLETLPPRFQKKYLEGNHINANYINAHSDGMWDGNSLVFQGTNQNSSSMPPKYHVQRMYASQTSSLASLSPDQVHQPQSLNIMQQQQPYQNPVSSSLDQKYYTLPKGGRGRASRKPPDFGHPIGADVRGGSFDDLGTEGGRDVRRRQHARSVESIPDELARSSEPLAPPVRLTEETAAPTTPAFRPSLETQLSPVSPATPPAAVEPSASKRSKETTASTAIMDWSEEVELHVRLEAEETLSDAITRSSSVASLVDTNNTSSAQVSSSKSHRSRNRNASKPRDNSTDKMHYSSRHRDVGGGGGGSHHHSNRNRHNSHSGMDLGRSTDGLFKVPEGRARRRTSSHNRSRNASRESSYDRAPSTRREPENWREEILRSRRNSEREITSVVNAVKDISTGRKAPGIIVLPNREAMMERPKYPDVRQLTNNVYTTSSGPQQQQQAQQHQKSLFNHNNPRRPIIVESNSSRISAPGFSDPSKDGSAAGALPPQLGIDQFSGARPNWYDENTDSFGLCRYPGLLRDVRDVSQELQNINDRGDVLVSWHKVSTYRGFLMESLQYLLCKDLKFCQSENVEQFFWKILYHNIIEMMRKAISGDLANKNRYKEFVLYLIDEGNKYFEGLLELLEETYRFKLTDHLGYKNMTHQRGLGFVGLALVSSQKLFLYLGDLGRYREIINETSNYGKCRQWYIKALELNPKNGKPYNQLAILAVYARRKLDAVYYYMRSLMSSNPVPSAKEFLNTLIDENRKKYEQGERKRREERLEKARQHMKIKESESTEPPGSLRREIWVRPDGGRRVHRTTSAVQEHKSFDSEEEDLAALTPLEVNKRFITSYLHVHGKLITRIGMESFQEAALQMLKEFRALLQHTPMPLNCNRFLQLLALNMFAIESTQLKDPQLQSTGGYRSEFQERALVVSLQMFNLILERSVALLMQHHDSMAGTKNHHHQQHHHLLNNVDEKNGAQGKETVVKSDKGGNKNKGNFPIGSLHPDFQTLLPAIKIWCDWMLCHSSVWNPPPSTLDYRVGPPGDAWNRLATLMNQLENVDLSVASSFVSKSQDGYETVRLPEDSTLYGFTPLMYNEHEPSYAPSDVDVETAQLALRTSKVHFFGTVFLCGLEPPVLKLEIDNDFSEYVSVVRTSSNADSPSSPPELIDDDDLLVESFSEDEETGGPVDKIDESSAAQQQHLNSSGASSEVRQLLCRKVELEKRQRTQELHRQRVQKILQQSIVSVQIEIRPKVLVPDTNCFIDYLDMIKTTVDAHVYTLMVPLIVLNELEGLTRGGKYPLPPQVARHHADADPQHVAKVAEAARSALDYLGRRHTNIKCVTTKGTTLPTFTFTVEDDTLPDSALKNDDKILATCLTLCKGCGGAALVSPKDGVAEVDNVVSGEPKKLYREVVLLTEDRNLRVKALARDLPVRELPDFMKWAGLG